MSTDWPSTASRTNRMRRSSWRTSERSLSTARPTANVLVLHAGLEGVRQDYHEVNEIALAPEELASGEYQYIALGHLHRYHAPQVNAIYAGSLERLDFGDLEGDKAVLEVDLSAGAGSSGFVLRHPVPTRPMHDLHVACEGLTAPEVLDALEAAGRRTLRSPAPW